MKSLEERLAWRCSGFNLNRPPVPLLVRSPTNHVHTASLQESDAEEDCCKYPNIESTCTRVPGWSPHEQDLVFHNALKKDKKGKHVVAICLQWFHRMQRETVSREEKRGLKSSYVLFFLNPKAAAAGLVGGNAGASRLSFGSAAAPVKQLQAKSKRERKRFSCFKGSGTLCSRETGTVRLECDCSKLDLNWRAHTHA